MGKRFAFIGAQLDLARQPETLEHIKDFVDFIAKERYNCLTLYLEGRIRTKTFPFMDKSESYTPDDIGRIVDYAGKKKIDVMPIVSTLGHAEHFLEQPELEHLAELRGGRMGRFSKAKHVFCPSLEETYEFLESYLKEISVLFPFEYFHAGCDEAWDMGICELCREKEQSGIFADHLKKIYEIITVKLRKKMIIWDDLFECYPTALEKVPRDVVMCTWQYEKLVEIPLGHFGNRQRTDKFALYDRMGFKYIFAPTVWSMRNIRSITEYASRYKSLGGLLTMWGLRQSFPFRSRPAAAYAGRLWSGISDLSTGNIRREEEAAIRDVSGIKDPVVLAVVRSVLNISLMQQMRSDRNAYLRGILLEDEFDKYCVIEAAVTSLEPYRGNNNIIDDLLLSLEGERCYYDIRASVAGILESLRPKIRADSVSGLKSRIEEIEKLKSAAAGLWRKSRKGILVYTDEFYDSVTKMLYDLAKDLEKAHGFLELFLCLPCYHGVQRIAVRIKYEDGDEWENVTDGVFKQFPSQEPFYSYKFPVSANRTPKEISFISKGYGGQGVTFVEVVNSKGHFIPAAISSISGLVQKPEHILYDDRRWCLLGEQDAGRVYLSLGMSEYEHRMDVILKRLES